MCVNTNLNSTGYNNHSVCSSSDVIVKVAKNMENRRRSLRTCLKNKANRFAGVLGHYLSPLCGFGLRQLVLVKNEYSNRF